MTNSSPPIRATRCPRRATHQKLSSRTDTPIFLRSRADLTTQFDGWDLVPPGLVHIPQWRPDSPLDVDDRPGRFGALAGLGRRS